MNKKHKRGREGNFVNTTFLKAEKRDALFYNIPLFAKIHLVPPNKNQLSRNLLSLYLLLFFIQICQMPISKTYNNMNFKILI